LAAKITATPSEIFSNSFALLASNSLLLNGCCAEAETASAIKTKGVMNKRRVVSEFTHEETSSFQNLLANA
jgi:hypothetical protein